MAQRYVFFSVFIVWLLLQHETECTQNEYKNNTKMILQYVMNITQRNFAKVHRQTTSNAKRCPSPPQIDRKNCVVSILIFQKRKNFFCENLNFSEHEKKIEKKN